MRLAAIHSDVHRGHERGEQAGDMILGPASEQRDHLEYVEAHHEDLRQGRCLSETRLAAFDPFMSFTALASGIGIRGRPTIARHAAVPHVRPMHSAIWRR